MSLRSQPDLFNQVAFFLGNRGCFERICCLAENAMVLAENAKPDFL